ncbi:hypothetical protein HID58_069843, partial [Brassica napus]
KRAISCQKIRGEDKISDCHDVCSVDKRGCGYHDFVKRWMFCGRRSKKKISERRLGGVLGQFVCKRTKEVHMSMQFHKAPLLYRLISELGPHCPLDVGVEIRNWIVRFVNYGSISCGRYVQGNRHEDGNVKKFTVKVPCLETLECVNEGSIVLNEEGVEDFRGYFMLPKTLSQVRTTISVCSKPDDKFMRSLSSLKYLELHLCSATVPQPHFLFNSYVGCCQEINFLQLIECKIIVDHQLDWFEPLVIDLFTYCNQPISVPVCMSTNLEIFEWKENSGTAGEKKVVRYILANSKYLKRFEISLNTSFCNLKKKLK